MTAEYAFRHALLGEAVYDDLLPGERMRLHTAYAEAVRELHGRTGAADLARHALASHDLPTALQASVEAGDQALATGGPDEAARHFTKALEIYDKAARQLDDPPDEAELVARTVDALCSSGRPETALALVDSHLARLAGDTPPVSKARLLLARVEALRSTETDAAPEPGQRGGARARRPRAETQLRARILAMHAQALVWDDRFDEARDAGGRGPRARRPARAAAARRRRRRDADLAQPAPRLRRGQPCRAEADHRGRPRPRRQAQRDARATCAPVGSSTTTARSPQAQEAFLEAARLARELGRPWTIHGISGRMQAAVMAYMRGDWDLALTHRRPQRRGPATDAARDARRRSASRWRPDGATSRRWHGSRPCASGGTARG